MKRARNIEEHVAKEVLKHMLSDRYKALRRYEEAAEKVKLLRPNEIRLCLECGIPCDIRNMSCCAACSRAACEQHSLKICQHKCWFRNRVCCTNCTRQCSVCERIICSECKCMNDECETEHCADCVPECDYHFRSPLRAMRGMYCYPHNDAGRKKTEKQDELISMLIHELYPKLKFELGGKWIGLMYDKSMVVGDTHLEVIQKIDQQQPNIVTYLPNKSK